MMSLKSAVLYISVAIYTPTTDMYLRFRRSHNRMQKDGFR